MSELSTIPSSPKPTLTVERVPHYYRAGHHGNSANSAGLSLALAPEEDRINIEARRGKAGQLVGAIHKAFGVAPVQAPLTVSTGEVDFVGVGVSRWHFISRGANRDAHRALLKQAAVDFATLVDVSHGFTTFAIRGPGAIQTLAKLVRCDLDEMAFSPGACAATEIHGMSVQLRRTLGNTTYECAVPRSFGGSLFHALVAAAEENGIYVEPVDLARN